MSGTLVLVTTYVGGAMRSYETAVSQAVCDIAAERGYQVRILSGGLPNCPDGNEAMRNFVYDMVPWKDADGVFLLSAALSIFLRYEGYAEFCKKFEPLPMVSIGVPVNGIPWVGIDNRAAMKDLTRHLLEKHGVKKPLYIGGPFENRESRLRGEGYLDALSDAGLHPDPSMLLEGTFHKDSGYRMIQDWFASGGDFDAVVCANDEMAVGVAEFLSGRGMIPPRDYLLTGFDDLEVSRLMVPALTSVSQQIYGMARTACGMLCDRIEGRGIPGEVLYPTRLRIRESCGCGTYAPFRETLLTLPEDREGIYNRLNQQLPPLSHAAETYLQQEFRRVLDILEHPDRDERESLLASHLPSLLSGLESRGIDPVIWEQTVLFLEATRLGRSSISGQLWDEIRFRICEAGQLEVRRHRVMSERLASLLRQIGEELINTHSDELLKDVLGRDLPGLPLSGLEIALFEQENGSRENLRTLVRWTRSGGVVILRDSPGYPATDGLDAGSPLAQEKLVVVEGLIFNREVIGLLFLAMDTPNGTLCNSLREMLSGVMKNITFWKETRERSRLMEILYRTEKVFSSWPDERTVISEWQKAIHGWLHNEYTQIWRVLPESGELVPVSRMDQGSFIPVTSVPVTSDQPLTEPIPFEENGYSGTRIPVFGGGKLVAVTDIGYSHEQYHELGSADMRVLGMFANQAVVALNNARLYRKTIRSSEQIRDLNSELALKLKRLTSLRAIDTAITDSPDRNTLVGVLLTQIREQLNADAVLLLLHDTCAGLLLSAGGSGFGEGKPGEIRLKLGQGLAGKAALTQDPVFVESLEPAEDTRFDGEFSGYCAVPLLSRGELKGVLELFYRQPLTPGEEWREFLTVLAGQTAIALDHSGLVDGLRAANEELIRAWDATIEGWSRALDFRDQETEGHSRRVTEMAEELALAAGIPEPEMVHIHRGALLHDIGKMGIPDSILLKPGPLDDRERAIMKKHPELAREMLASIGFLGPALDIPLYHHERWDGTGYPEGRKGEEIPLTARVFALVDVWDALTSDRPYRQAWSPEKTAEHIRSRAGTHFDPELTAAFLKLRGF